MASSEQTTIGVAIVSFASSDVILACLDSLIASDHEALKIVICENASPDNTAQEIRDWAASNNTSFNEVTQGASGGKINSKLTMVNAPKNLGYAGGANQCIKVLMNDPDISLFWVLNPDCVVEPATASQLVSHASNCGPFSLMGSRVLYHREDSVIQSDGGRVNKWTGVCSNLNQGQDPKKASTPNIEELDFISGANFVASREFIEKVGLMKEDYFLYFEEVDWAMRRGDLPLTWSKDALVHHHGGTAIGSGAHDRGASGFANYFNFRNRMMFMFRFNKLGLPLSYVYTSLKIIKVLIKDGKESAIGGWLGLNGMRPPKAIFNKIAPEARELAFGRHGKSKS